MSFQKPNTSVPWPNITGQVLAIFCGRDGCKAVNTNHLSKIYSWAVEDSSLHDQPCLYEIRLGLLIGLVVSLEKYNNVSNKPRISNMPPRPQLYWQAIHSIFFARFLWGMISHLTYMIPSHPHSRIFRRTVVKCIPNSDILSQHQIQCAAFQGVPSIPSKRTSWKFPLMEWRRWNNYVCGPFIQKNLGLDTTSTNAVYTGCEVEKESWQTQRWEEKECFAYQLLRIR